MATNKSTVKAYLNPITKKLVQAEAAYEGKSESKIAGAIIRGYYANMTKEAKKDLLKALDY